MSIQSEINRISGNVSDALDAIELKGVTIPSGANSDDLAELITLIQGGSGEDGYVWQDAQGYVHLSDEEGTGIVVDSLAISGAGTYTAPTKHAYSPVTVPGGSAATPATSVTATPSLTLNSSGLITATVSATKSVTPNITEGWVDSGTAGTVTVSGSNTIQLSTQAAKSITPTESQQTAVVAGKYTTGDVTVDAISSYYVGSSVTRRSSTDLTASGATVTAPAGYYASAASKAIASGSATPAASITGTAATVSTGTNTLTLSKTVSNTPQISAGYVSAGTAGKSNVSLTANVTTKAATTYHPSSSQQAIASGTYLTGTQTINAVTTTNLTAANIKNGVTVTVGDSSDPDSVTSVTGTYEGETAGDYKLYISGSGNSFTVQPAGASRQNFVDGTVYSFNEGDSIIFRVVDGGIIYYNGTQVARNLASTVSYTLTAPGVNITATANAGDYTININSWINPSNVSPLSVTENGTYTAPAGSAYTPVTVNVSGGTSPSPLYSGEFTYNVTSTSATHLNYYSIGTSPNVNTLYYTRIRDKAGPRAGYYYGCDVWAVASDASGQSTYIAMLVYRCDNNGGLRVYHGGTSYGIYPNNPDDTGSVELRGRYNATYTSTIDGTFEVETYELTWPTVITPST